MYVADSKSQNGFEFFTFVVYYYYALFSSPTTTLIPFCHARTPLQGSHHNIIPNAFVQIRMKHLMGEYHLELIIRLICYFYHSPPHRIKATRASSRTTQMD